MCGSLSVAKHFKDHLRNCSRNLQEPSHFTIYKLLLNFEHRLWFCQICGLQQASLQHCVQHLVVKHTKDELWQWSISKDYIERYLVVLLASHSGKGGKNRVSTPKKIYPELHEKKGSKKCKKELDIVKEEDSLVQQTHQILFEEEKPKKPFDDDGEFNEDFSQD